MLGKRSIPVKGTEGYIKKGNGHHFKSLEEKFLFMQRLSKEGHNIGVMSECLCVSRSGYYSWRKRIPSKRTIENIRILKEIQTIHKESMNVYGSPSIFNKLKTQGLIIGKNRVARIMKNNGIRSIIMKKFKAPKTTDSKHNLGYSPNLLNQQFHVKKPNEVWVSDLTYIPYANGFLYLCQIKDLCTKKVVGWSIDTHMKTEMVLTALRNAVITQKPKEGLIFHSDRGSQYASTDFREALTFHKMNQSMSRKGNCYDNAPAESFFSTLKREFTNHRRFKNLEEARSDIFYYIEIFYNRKRLHSAIDYKTPVMFELEFAA
ncbi:IS3 family transposase [Leptospira sp. 'Mane']|uniref:IS3 family transposase n=1 Tax=Leptospira sp. 'Mane' TaxID=3387407 RepID=UPI00398B61BF